MKLLYAIVTVALLVTSCKKNNTEAQLGENIIEEGNCITNVKGQGVTIWFNKLEEDTRCPENMMCIIAGGALCGFTFKDSQGTINFKLVNLNLSPYHQYKTDTTINGVSIILKNVTPYPGQSGYNVKKKKVTLEIK